MAKPRKYGYFKPFTHNSRADMRFNKKLYQRGRDTDDFKQRKDQKRMEGDKLGILEVQSNR